jgi:hypothetical protein
VSKHQDCRIGVRKLIRLARATLTAGAVSAFLVLPPNLTQVTNSPRALLLDTRASKIHCPSAEFGTAVAISGDTAAVGAPSAHVGGAVCVYGRSHGHWSLQAVLKDPGHGKYDEFGTAVAVSSAAERTYAMVGAWQDGSGNGNTQPDGPVYVYVRSHGSWRRIQTIRDPLGYHPGNWFGATLAMSGGSAVITAEGVHNFRGAAYVYGIRNGSWHIQATLPNHGAHDLGGLAAISGATVVLGDGGTGSPPGSVQPIHDCVPPKSPYPDAWVYARAGSKWHLQAHITARTYDNSESSVAISGATILVGAFFVACGGDNKYDGRGDAYVFTRRGHKWHWTSTIADPAHSHGDFGTGLGISGSNAVIGSPYSQNVCGVAYGFKWQQGKWVLGTTLEPPGGGKCGKAEGFGWAVAVSGQTAVIGAPGNGKTYVLKFS